MNKIIFGVNINLVLFSISFGVLKLLQNFFDLIYTWIIIVKPSSKYGHHIFSICLIVFIMPCAVCLIIGAIQRKRYLILTWLICSIMDMLSIFRIFATDMSLIDVIYRITEMSKNKYFID